MGFGKLCPPRVFHLHPAAVQRQKSEVEDGDFSNYSDSIFFFFKRNWRNGCELPLERGGVRDAFVERCVSTALCVGTSVRDFICFASC